jgi:hypothetical protein
MKIMKNYIRIFMFLYAFMVDLPVAHAAAKWSYASSPHFEVFTSGNEQHARDAIADFESVHAFFEKALDLPSASAPRTRLVVFSSPKEFDPYKPNAVAHAFYLNAPGGDYIVMQSLDADAFPVVVHEYAHLMIRRTGADYPLWLNEGFAEFYSTMAPEGRKMRLGLAPLQRVQLLATTVRLIPLERLLAIDDRAPEYNDPVQAPLFYAECWAMTHMLISHESYRARSAAFFSEVSHGTPATAALSAVYGRPMAAINEDLGNYARRGTYASSLADSPDSAHNLRITAGPVDDMDVAITLAAIIGWQHDREEQGRVALAALDARGSGSLRLAEARGLLEMYMKNEDAATPYLAKAVSLGSVNATVLRAYAGLIGTSDPERQEALLGKAVSISPDDIDVRIDLARVLVDRDRGAEAMKTVAGITRIPRDRTFAFYEVLTLACVSAGEIDDARAAAAHVTAAARTEPEKMQAETLTREAATTRPRRQVIGRLTNVICGDGQTVLEVTTADGVLRLAIDNPRDIKIGGGPDTTIALECGAQDRPIRVGYVAVTDERRRTAGTVRMIEFVKLLDRQVLSLALAGLERNRDARGRQ